MSNGQQPGIDGGQCVQLAHDNGWLWTAGHKLERHKLEAHKLEGQSPPTLLLAHGAGAPMDSDFMNDMAAHLATEGVNVMRFEFPYMVQRRQNGGRRPPNPQAQLLDCWRDVYARVQPHVAGHLAIGGKSMGGRMASLVADQLNAHSLVCLGYPFHPAGKPEKTRVAHLVELKTPTLIVQGERDALGSRDDVQGYVLSDAIEVQWLATANHDLKPLKVAGVSHEQNLRATARMIAAFLRR